GKLEKRVAVITAAGSGIGAATARRFAKEGARIVIGDLSGKRAEAVAGEIQSTGARVEWLKMDAADPDGAQALVWRALDAFGQIDIMINNGGRAEVAPLVESSADSWDGVGARQRPGSAL